MSAAFLLKTIKIVGFISFGSFTYVFIWFEEFIYDSSSFLTIQNFIRG